MTGFKFDRAPSHRRQSRRGISYISGLAVLSRMLKGCLIAIGLLIALVVGVVFVTSAYSEVQAQRYKNMLRSHIWPGQSYAEADAYLTASGVSHAYWEQENEIHVLIEDGSFLLFDRAVTADIRLDPTRQIVESVDIQDDLTGP